MMSIKENIALIVYNICIVLYTALFLELRFSLGLLFAGISLLALYFFVNEIRENTLESVNFYD